VAALTDQVMRYGVRRAEGRGGRLDPPLLCMLDEAANICPLADLPQLYSHYGGRGIILVTILQTYQQGTTVWGDRGMGTLWGAAPRQAHGAGRRRPPFGRRRAGVDGGARRRAAVAAPRRQWASAPWGQRAPEPHQGPGSRPGAKAGSRDPPPPGCPPRHAA